MAPCANNSPLTVSPTHLFSELAIRSAIFPLVRGLWKTRLVAGREFLLQGPCFLYGNHSNNLDPFLVNWDLPLGRSSSGVLTAEYMQGGPIAAAFRGIGLLSTRKRVPEPHLVPRITRKLRSGRSVLIYPEGGRRWDGRPAPWIESTAKLFSRLPYPVHPVLTHGSYMAWPRWADWPRPARIEVEVLPAVHLTEGGSLAHHIGQLAAPIQGDENIARTPVRPTRAFRPADGIHRLLYRDPATGMSGDLFTPDGYAITNRSGSIRWSMLPDSRIRDVDSGEVFLTGDLYARIRAMPLLRAKDGSILSNRVAFHEGPTPGRLRPLGTAEARLFEDHLTLATPGHAESVPLEAIHYEGIERNYKLQLTLRSRILQLSFTGRGSALQWMDTLTRIRTEAV